ncbi:division plane positioning ATPase MipZ [Halarcobacter sp.]|uniref:nucleotide-binding protein n=1 Tax=Halarcobacter sp. TaxID=2321133 RepID=UPI0029F46452|nr:division plane positioning ATPase MipZ [Halarcobacter sp.]
MIIIPQTKGGVGKSTVAMQVIAPYLYKKHGKKVTYIEIDDENNDSKSFTRTEIVNKRMLGTNKLTELDELILMDDNHEIIVDVGGNKTSSLVLEEIKKVGSFGNIKWIIPLGDGELDGKNAIATLKKIKKIEQDLDNNILFALNRAISMDADYVEEQFINFFGHKYLDSNSVICDFIKDPKYFPVKNDKVITMSRYLGSTVWEMAYNNTDFAAKAMKAKELGDIESARKYLFFRRIQTEAKDYVLGTLNKIFYDLDTWLNIKK